MDIPSKLDKLCEEYQRKALDIKQLTKIKESFQSGSYLFFGRTVLATVSELHHENMNYLSVISMDDKVTKLKADVDLALIHYENYWSDITYCTLVWAIISECFEVSRLVPILQ